MFSVCPSAKFQCEPPLTRKELSSIDHYQRQIIGKALYLELRRHWGEVFRKLALRGNRRSKRAI